MTGDCGGKLECDGSGAAPPTSLFEITLGHGSDDKDFYDVSLVDGYNLPIVALPTGELVGACNATGCVADINISCPKELQVVGEEEEERGVVACKSACEAFGLDQYCCSGQFANPNTCRPSSYSTIFKRACPRAYSYAFDDGTSTFTCKASEYAIIFCPGRVKRPSSQNSDPQNQFGQPMAPPTENPYGQPMAPPTQNPYGQPMAPPTQNQFGQPIAPPTQNQFGQPMAPPTQNQYGQPMAPPTQNQYGQPMAPPTQNQYGQPITPPTQNQYGQPMAPPTQNQYGQPMTPTQNQYGQPIAPLTRNPPGPNQNQNGESMTPPPQNQNGVGQFMPPPTVNQDPNGQFLNPPIADESQRAETGRVAKTRSSSDILLPKPVLLLLGLSLTALRQSCAT